MSLEENFQKVSIGNRQLKRELYTFFYLNTRLYTENYSAGSTNKYYFFDNGVILINIVVTEEIKEVLKRLEMGYVEIVKVLAFDGDSCIIQQDCVNRMLDKVKRKYEKYK